MKLPQLPELSTISTVITTLKGAYELAKELSTAKMDKEEQMRSLELVQMLLTLQGNIHEVREEHMNIIQTVRELEEKLKERESWDATESRYEMKEVGPGVLIYSLKTSDQSGEPMHWLCPHCWQNREKSILQCTCHHDSYASYLCHRCKNEVKWHNPLPATHFGFMKKNPAPPSSW